jgi:1,4-alpha-glucan branching enzyme
VDNENLKYRFMGAFDKAMLDFVKHHPVMQAPPAWMLYADEDNKTVVYERGNLIFVFNWGPKSIPDYKIPVRQTGDYRIILTSDDKAFGGFGNIDASVKFPSEKNKDDITMKVYNVSRTATVYQRIP